MAAVGTGAEKAWPLALARAARDMFALMLDLAPVRGQRLSLAELLELPPDRGMLCLLEGPRGGLGVLMLAPEVLAGLIEAQTLGRVSDLPVVARRPTRTDAAMVAEFVDATLTGLETALLSDEDLTWTDGFRYTSFLEDPRPLALMLEDAPFKVLVAEARLGAGEKSGTVILALPAEGHGRRPLRNPALAHGTKSHAPDSFSDDLSEQVLAVDATLHAVLYRMTVPLSAVMGLKVDDLIPLPMAALERIEVLGMDGRRLGCARLGQNRGMRAIRISDDKSSQPGNMSPAAGLGHGGFASAAAHNPADEPGNFGGGFAAGEMDTDGAEADAGFPVMAMAMPLDIDALGSAHEEDGDLAMTGS